MYMNRPITIWLKGHFFKHQVLVAVHWIYLFWFPPGRYYQYVHVFPWRPWTVQCTWCIKAQVPITRGILTVGPHWIFPPPTTLKVPRVFPVVSSCARSRYPLNCWPFWAVIVTTEKIWNSSQQVQIWYKVGILQLPNKEMHPVNVLSLEVIVIIETLI